MTDREKLRAELAAVSGEVERAMDEFPSMRSAHEGYAIILEEVDELWEAVRCHNVDGQLEEALQVAAMAVRFLVDHGGETWATNRAGDE